jgi:hypothetical protein
MPRPTLLALALSLAAATAAQAEGPALTIYSSDFDAVMRSAMPGANAGLALVREPVRVPVRNGAGVLVRDDLPAGLDLGSVQLSGTGLRVTGQRQDLPDSSPRGVLEDAIGRRVTVEQNGIGGPQVFRGVLLSANGPLTLREDSGALRVLSGYSSLVVEGIEPRGVVRPTLRLDVAGDRDGERAATLDYATAGLGWRAEYQARLREGGGRCEMAWQGHALVANRSGRDFRDVRLTLVAGAPNRAPAAAPDMIRVSGTLLEAKAMAADAVPESGRSSEYHRYTLPAGGDLPDGSVQRLALLSPADAVACERRYEVGGEGGGWLPPHPLVDRQFGALGELPVSTVLAFRNDRGSGLGVALPAGRVRAFDGDELLGEAALEHTAAGRDIRLPMGQAFDLSAERRSEDFQLDRSGREMTETVVVRLRNAKPQAATVQVTEPMQRWTDWDIVQTSHPAVAREATSARFAVTVPAGGETELRYTVRYRWPASITLP